MVQSHQWNKGMLLLIPTFPLKTKKGLEQVFNKCNCDAVTITISDV